MKNEFKSVLNLFEEQANRTPEKKLVISGVYNLTYKELNDMSNKMAHYLVRKGVGDKKKVIIYMDYSVEMIVAVLAVVKTGAAYMPINENVTGEYLNEIIYESKAEVVVGKKIKIRELNIGSAKAIKIDEDWPIISKEDSSNIAIDILPDSIFYGFYSGPLGDLGDCEDRCHMDVVRRLKYFSSKYPFEKDDVCCLHAGEDTLDHTIALFCALVEKISLVIFNESHVKNIEDLLLAVSINNVTRLHLTSLQLNSILLCDTELEIDFSKLKYVFYTGEILSASLVDVFEKRFRRTFLINGSERGVFIDPVFADKRLNSDSLISYFYRHFECFPQNRIKNSGGEDEGGHIKRDITIPFVENSTLANRFKKTRMPEFAMAIESYFDWFNKEVLPYSINTASPLFIGHMTSALPDFLHDISKLISQLNQNLVKVETAKSLIFLEREALAMLHRCFYRMPDDFYEYYVQKVNTNLGLVTTGGTISNVTALMIARNRTLSHLQGGTDWSGSSIYSVLQSSGYKDLVILGSRLMHYSIKKSASILGLGLKNIIYVDFDNKGELDVGDLVEKLNRCEEERLLVFSLVGIAGATETGHIDPLNQMADIAESRGIFFHVDAAWGGAGLFSDEYRARFKGLERADSVTFCAHKQLYLPQGVSICLFRDPKNLNFGSMTAAYQATPDTYDVGRFSIEGSRSAMSLLVHAALQIIGQKGYASLFDISVEKAVLFADIIDSLDCFELIHPPPLNIVNYRYIPERYREDLRNGDLGQAQNQTINEINRRIQETQFEEGATFVSKTTLNNTRYGVDSLITVFRVVLANPLTAPGDIFQVLRNQINIANRICGDQNIDELNHPGIQPHALERHKIEFQIAENAAFSDR